eukprot:12894979-Prorocentrum_lima.AAC.1
MGVAVGAGMGLRGNATMLTSGFGWCHKSSPLPHVRNFSTSKPSWGRILQAGGGGQHADVQ